MHVQVTTGEEGFFAAGDPAIADNPAGTWSGETGQDFRNNHVRPFLPVCSASDAKSVVQSNRQ